MMLTNKWSMLIALLVVTMATNRQSSAAENWKSKDDTHQENWVDPTDMLNYDSFTKEMKSLPPIEEDHNIKAVEPKPSIGGSTASNRCTTSGVGTKSETPFLRRFVSYLLMSLNVNMEDDTQQEHFDFDVTLKITKVQMETLRKFVLPNNKMHLSDIDEILTTLIKKVKVKDYSTFDLKSQLEWLLEKLSYCIASPLLLTMCCCSLLTFLLWNLTPTKILILGLMASVIISVVLDYTYLYQKREAQKAAERMKFKDLPLECSPSEAGQLQQIFWSLKYDILGFEDPCEKYYENLLVDSRFEINLLTAATRTVGRIITSFSGIFGTSIGVFWSNALDNFSFLGKLFFSISSVTIIIAFLYFIGTTFVQGWMRPLRNIRIRNMIEDINTDNQPRSPPPQLPPTNIHITLLQPERSNSRNATKYVEHCNATNCVEHCSATKCVEHCNAAEICAPLQNSDISTTSDSTTQTD